MDADRIGALAAVCSKDGNRIKIVCVGEHGRLLDADGTFLVPSPGSTLELLDDENGNTKIMSTWTEGTLTESAFERSTVAACTLGSATENPCFFYQGQDLCLYMKTFGKANSGAWDHTLRVIEANAAFPPYPGTALSVHLDESGDYMYLYYQANRPEAPGEIVGCKLSSSGAVVVRGGPLFTKTMPLGIPFVVIARDRQWSLFYAKAWRECLGEAYGSIKQVAVDPATGGDSEVFETSRLPAPFIELGRTLHATAKVTQVSAYHFEKPTLYVPEQALAPGSSSKWMPDGIMTYRGEWLALPCSGVALASHLPQWKRGNAIYVDQTGAVNICRLSTSTKTTSHCGFPKQIPLESMRTAYAWAVPPVNLPVLPVPVVPPVVPNPPNDPPPVVPVPVNPRLPIMDPVTFQRDLVKIVSEVVQQEFARRDAQTRLDPSPSPSSDRKLWAHRGCLETPWKKSPKVHKGRVQHFVLASEQKLWQASPARLTYFFMEGSEVQWAKVRQVVREWELYASVEFVEVARAADSLIRIKFDGSDGSWSFVGRDCENAKKDEPTMNLGWIGAEDDSIPPNEHGVILHEFGHALGLLHEHQSPARGGGGAMLDEKKTIMFYKESQLGWDDAMIREQIIDVYADKEVSNFSELDTTSIMHYPMPRQVTGLSYDIPYNSQLSQMDKAYMVINYPRAEPHPKAPDWTLETALQKAGVPADIQDAILSVPPRNGRPDAHEIRRLFSNWVLNKRVERRKVHYTPSIDPRRARFLDNPDASVVVQPLEPYGDCSNAEAVQMRKKGAAHSVTVRSALWEIKDSDDGNPDFAVTIPYKWAAQKDEVLTTYRKQLVRKAMATWEEHASIEFEREPWDDPKLVIAFEDGRPDDELSSYTTALGKDLKLVKGSPGVMHSVLFRIFPDQASADAFDKAKPHKGGRRNRRTALHELGHVLGLHHECHGFLASFTENQKPAVGDKDKLKQTSTIKYDDVGHLVSTKYDFTSVMDGMSIKVREMAADLISRYSFDVDWNAILNVHNRIKLNYELSEYDIANIALLYPGKRLIAAVIPGEEPPYDLAEHNHGVSTVRHYCEILGLTPQATDILEEHATHARWTSLREDYLVALQEAMRKYWQEAVEELQKKALGQVVPSRGLKPPEPGRRFRALDPSQPVPPPVKPFKDLLYEKLDSIFGSTGNQYLALQLPTRYLDKSSFAYKTTGIYSNFTKPVVVNEAEFRLTDELFDVAKIVSGPNGKSLSLLYEQALNNLVPKYQEDKLREQRERIRNWLLTKVDSEVVSSSSADTQLTHTLDDDDSSAPKSGRVYGMQAFAQLVDPDDPTLGEDKRTLLSKKSSTKSTGDGSAPARALGGGRTSNTVTRIEFSQTLMLDYLKERMDWELTRDKMINKAMESGDTKKLEQVTRLLAHITAVHENRLAAKYGDVVVRGHLHTVREYLGYLDVKSTAESLQGAKDSLRESAMSSVYGSRVIYPVLMQPVDWFEALDTSFASEDLSQSVEILQLQLTQKSTRLDTLNDQLSTYMFAAEGNMDTLKTDVENLTRARDDASAKLTRQYTQQTINAAKMYLEASSEGSAKKAGKIAADKNPPDEAKSLLESIDLNAIAQGINDVSEADSQLLSAGRALAGKLAQLEKARATDTRAQQAVIQRQITKVRAEIQELYEQLEIAKIASKKRSERVAKSIDGVGLPPAGDARWIDVSFETSVSNKVTTRETSSSASTSSWNVNLWLGSASGNSSSSSASMSASDVEQHVKVSISLRVSLVTVDRSGWFQPQFFDMSDAFMRASEYVRWSEWPKDVNSAADAIKRIKAATEGGGFDAGQSLLPAFPVGYIIAKDVLVKLSSSSSSSSSSTKSFSEQSAASGGVLCFSYSHASQSSGDSSSVSTQEMADGLVIKIPGPQILGYVMQLTPKDATHKYEPSESTFFLPTDLDKDKDSAGRPLHSVDGQPPITKPADKAATTTVTTAARTNTSHANGRAHALPNGHGLSNGNEHPNGETQEEERRERRPAAGIMEDIHSLVRDPESLGLVLDMAKILKDMSS
ncbi:hypothetical protein BV25DRAFT_1826806 [Artomyces pyxidatus]|uniref:Uncharacterized protein n=1 Tax=Artomyces pyxidatus TaxID=48021 RepID=A0ACB8SZD4_9AGAM|nr:hypothetical protein BV25DRAFT_1826806 [Artomyces pyxidatus]